MEQMETIGNSKENIEKIIDDALQKWIEMSLNQLPADIEKEMLAPVQEDEEWQFWIPIDSTVTDEDLADFEKENGLILPEDFKTVFKHKHFYELQISEVSLCANPINTWKNSLHEMIFETYPREYLFDKGYIPFAVYSDWGLLCFDTHSGKDSSNYPVVLWDHEDAEKFEFRYKDFHELMTEISGK